MLRRAATQALKAQRRCYKQSQGSSRLFMSQGGAAQPNFRIPFRSASILTICGGGAALAYYYPPVEFAINSPAKITNRVLTDSHHTHSSAEIEKLLHSLPVVEALRRDAFLKGEPDAWTETRLYATAKPAHSSHLIPHVLLGADKLSVPPLVRTRKDGTEAVIIIHVGSGVCGHNGIIHGGFIGVLFDQLLYNLGVKSLPSQWGATANLSIDYRAPARADQFLVIRASVEELAQTASGRSKILVKGTLETEDGKVLADARALIVEPRSATRFLGDA